MGKITFDYSKTAGFISEEEIEMCIRDRIETALEKQNRKDKTKKNFILPKKLGKKEIQWKAKSSHTVGILLLLGAVTGILLKFRGIERCV